MKLLIDIPEEAYKAFKEWHKNKVATVEQSLIANGTPYEERTQGEWIKVTKAGTVPVEYICSLCRRKIYDNYELTTPIDEFYPFCHCGADMRKGGAE